jgi:hypothetical protein
MEAGFRAKFDEWKPTSIQVSTSAFVETQNWPASCASHPFRGAVFLRVRRSQGGSLRSLTPGYIPHTPSACERSPEGCWEISPGLSEAIPGYVLINARPNSV